MKRREFLQATAVTGTAMMLGGPATANTVIEDIGRRLRKGLIWCKAMKPVALIGGGQAGGIADIRSQGGEANSDLLNDYHADFIKSFAVAGQARSASLSIFAYTRYRLYINGVYVGRGPSRYQNNRPEYDTWDVRLFLKSGTNRISILVHRDSPTGRIMFHAPGMATLLQFADQAGSHSLSTDETWLARPDPSFEPRDVAWASIEEYIDASFGDDWTAEDYPASDWPNAVNAATDVERFYPRTTPLLREAVIPWKRADMRRTLIAGDKAELTLERLTLAYHRLTFSADEGTRIEIRYGLPDGQSSGKGRYIARSGTQTWIGGDCFAFDRLTVQVISGRMLLSAAEPVETLYPFERVGQFSCSDPFLERVWTLCARSLEVLSEDAYIDCADRERVEWTDETPPAFECTRVMMAGPRGRGGRTYSDPRLLKALLRRIALTQKPDGQMKAHSCSERWDIHAIMEDRSCDWVIALRQCYDSSGDAALVRELWPALTRLLDWFLKRRTARGLVLAREWEVWDNPLRYQVCEGAGLNAFVYHALMDAAYLGERTGFRAQAKRFSTEAARLAQTFNELLWDDDAGAYYGGLFGAGSKVAERLDGKMFTGPFVHGRYQPTLQAALFALDSGVVPKSRRARLYDFIWSHQADAKLPMSHHFLFKALYRLESDAGDRQVLALIREKWRSMVESPWGTSWEGLGASAGSKVHIYGIVPAYFLATYVLGIRLEGPASDRLLRVEPRHGGLAHASGVVCTEFGPVPVTWHHSATNFRLRIVIPAGCEAVLRPPAGSGANVLWNERSTKARQDYRLASGEHHMSITL